MAFRNTLSRFSHMYRLCIDLLTQTHRHRRFHIYIYICKHIYIYIHTYIYMVTCRLWYYSQNNSNEFMINCPIGCWKSPLHLPCKASIICPTSQIKQKTLVLGGGLSIHIYIYISIDMVTFRMWCAITHCKLQ